MARRCLTDPQPSHVQLKHPKPTPRRRPMALRRARAHSERSSYLSVPAVLLCAQFLRPRTSVNTCDVSFFLRWCLGHMDTPPVTQRARSSGQRPQRPAKGPSPARCIVAVAPIFARNPSTPLGEQECPCSEPANLPSTFSRSEHTSRS